MMRLLLGAALLACASMGLGACGDDDDEGGGGCANAQMVCEGQGDDGESPIDCSQFDSAPASIKDCAAKATTCDAVINCLFAAAAGSGG
jgi:hypothetical protein